MLNWLATKVLSAESRMMRLMGRGVSLPARVYIWFQRCRSWISADICIYGQVDQIREAIATADIVFLSAASAWEIAIKSSLGKIRIPGSLNDAVAQSGFIELPIQFSHAAAVEILPQHHADPFDRMIAAQSKVEKLVLITHDRHFEPYGLPIIWT